MRAWPGMGDHFDRSAPGMHRRPIDYGVVVRGEMTLELDDGNDASAPGRLHRANGTRHRWRNPLPDLPDGVHLGGREARLIRPKHNGAEGRSR